MAISSANIRSRLWVIPVLCVLGGVGLSILTIAIDRAFDFQAVPRWLTGGADAAMGILTTVAGSMVSLIGLVLTITMVVVQLAMGQFSPRIVQTFLQDRPSQFAIGLFVATFTHAMISMREVHAQPEEQVPGVAIVVGYVLVVISIAMLVLYIDHIGRSLRVSALIELVGKDTRQLIDRRFPDLVAPDEPSPGVILAPHSGVLIEVKRAALVDLATRWGVVLHVQPGLGDYVAAGGVLVRVEGPAGHVDHDAVRRCLRSGLERTLDEDAAYGLRMLVDMAERALAGSPFLDPTTAVQCLDRIHDALRQIAVRRIDDGAAHDDGGHLRVTIPTMTWDDYVHLGFDEIRLAGYQSPQVSRRLRSALTDLLRVAPPERQGVLREQLMLLDGAVRGSGLAPQDEVRAVTNDDRGLG